MARPDGVHGPKPHQVLPCGGCPCCGEWQAAFEALRAHAIHHTEGEIRISPCDPECLICSEINWQQRDLPVPARPVTHAVDLLVPRLAVCCGRRLEELPANDLVALHPSKITCEGLGG